MSDRDRDDATRGDPVYTESRTRKVPVEVDGAPKGATEEVTDYRFVCEGRRGLHDACGPWVVNKLDAMRQGIEYARTGRLVEVVTTR
jgi:hypothetical protein